jgi:hypothetical protein
VAEHGMTNIITEQVLATLLVDTVPFNTHCGKDICKQLIVLLCGVSFHNEQEILLYVKLIMTVKWKCLVLNTKLEGIHALKSKIGRWYGLIPLIFFTILKNNDKI